MNSSSIYDDALSQLHLNYQTLQETMLNLGREQSKILESVTRIQNDLENYKDSQNDRLDEILTNIDADIRKVSQDAEKCSAQRDYKVAEFIRESVTQKQMDTFILMIFLAFVAWLVAFLPFVIVDTVLDTCFQVNNPHS